MYISPITAYNGSYHFKGLFGKRKSAGNSIKKEQKAYRNGLLEGQIMYAGTLLNRHSTLYFRPDLDWAKFGKYLKRKFADAPKVQTLIWGCSGGQEAYSLATLLKYHFGDDFKKFLPIEAMDINPKLIESNKEYQQTGFCVGEFVAESMGKALDIQSFKFDNNKAEKFVKRTSLSKYQFKDDILNSVNFSYSNILSGLDKINSVVPSIVMCRNMWPYINYEKYDDFAKQLYEKLASNSVVIIGGYDIEGEKCVKNSDTFPEVLLKNGFKPVYGLDNIGNLSDVKTETLVFEK